MRYLNGAELAGFIKERQAHQVRSLRQSQNIIPLLAILVLKEDPVINTFVRLKKAYGQEILVEVRVISSTEAEAPDVIKTLNADASVHGILVQLPLSDPSKTEHICNLIDPTKDVDGLGENARYDSATATAIMWLLSGYNIALEGKRVVLVGRGKLVGAPLAKLLRSSGIEPEIAASQTNLAEVLPLADVIISATGKPGLITSELVKEGGVVVDAGTASENGATVGDVAPELYERQDLTITPKIGGVGPLTITALFDNVIRAAGAS